MNRLPQLRVPVRVPVRLAAAVVAVVLAATAAPAEAWCDGARVTKFDRQEDGASVLITVKIRCADPGPATQTYFSLSVWQGAATSPKYVQASGGIQAPPSPIVCDGTTRAYQFNVRPAEPYADRTFRVGKATTEWALSSCTEVTPGNFQCTGDELTRQQVRIRP